MTRARGPAGTYLEITRGVDLLVTEHAENDPTVARYMIGRAAFVGIASDKGQKHAAEPLYKLADEFATGEGPG